jgi:hypothetical protein
MGTKNTRRVAASLAAAAATLAVAPAAHAATADVSGSITGSTLDITAPTIVAFTAPLTGFKTTGKASVGSWDVKDLRGTGKGWAVTVSAGVPKIDNVTTTDPKYTVRLLPADTPTNVDLTPDDAPTVATPAAQGSFDLLGPAAQVASAAEDANKGMGDWTFAQGADDLELGIPANAKVGAYTTTLTFTVASQPV